MQYIVIEINKNVNIFLLLLFQQNKSESCYYFREHMFDPFKNFVSQKSMSQLK